MDFDTRNANKMASRTVIRTHYGDSKRKHLTVISSSQLVVERLDNLPRFIFQDFSPIPSAAENTIPSQRDSTIEQIHRLEGLIAYAEEQKDWDEVERV